MIVLDGAHLTLPELYLAARHGAAVELCPEAEEAIRRGERAFAAHAASGKAIYGWTTGVGALEAARLEPADVPTFQRNLLLSHAAGVGAPSALDRVRAMLVARANVLAMGRSGVRLEVVRAILELVAHDVHPWVPEIGSVGASDLAPLAHASLLLIGEGWAIGADGRTRVPGRVAMQTAGIDLVELAGRDAFALINGTSQTLGTGTLAAVDAGRLVSAAEIAAALTMVGLDSRADFIDPRLYVGRQRPESVSGVAERLRDLVGAGASAPTLSARSGLREPLSSRFVPEVLGAAWASTERASELIERELNACVDNPCLLPDGEVISNVGAMGAQGIAEALDALTTSVVAVAVMSERRIARLLDPARNNGLPAFLVHPSVRAGLCSGLMLSQYTAAAVVAELRALGTPASTQSIPVSNGTEDYATMSALAARRAADAVELAEAVVAIEIIAATQAIDIRAVKPPSVTLENAIGALRGAVPTLLADRLLADDIDAALALLRTGVFDPA